MFSPAGIIAVIDDNDQLRNALVRLLSSHGYRAMPFASGEECVRAIATIEMSCAIVDIQMPGMSGIDLGRVLSATVPPTPLIFITGSDDPSLRKEALDLGCVAFLQKPADIPGLIGAVEKALATRIAPAHHADLCA